MKYFDSLPKSIKTDRNGAQTVFTNLMARVNLMSDKLANPLLFYSYDIQEGDTPEIIAEKYYGDPYRYWIILLSNNILDPQWEWPILNNAFNKHIQQKYVNVDPYTDIHHYEKIVTQEETLTQNKVVNVIEISFEEYDLLPDTQTITYPPLDKPTFNGGGRCIITTTKRAVTFFQYELELNESRRNIKLLKKEYAPQIETELHKLMK